MRISILLVRALSAAVERGGVARFSFLAEAGIEPTLLDDMHARISLNEYRRVVRTAYRLTGDPALGLHMGERLQPASFDVLGPLPTRVARSRVRSTSSTSSLRATRAAA